MLIREITLAKVVCNTIFFQEVSAGQAIEKATLVHWACSLPAATFEVGVKGGQTIVF